MPNSLESLALLRAALQSIASRIKCKLHYATQCFCNRAQTFLTVPLCPALTGLRASCHLLLLVLCWWRVISTVARCLVVVPLVSPLNKGPFYRSPNNLISSHELRSQQSWRGSRNGWPFIRQYDCLRRQVNSYGIHSVSVGYDYTLRRHHKLSVFFCILFPLQQSLRNTFGAVVHHLWLHTDLRSHRRNKRICPK